MGKIITNLRAVHHSGTRDMNLVRLIVLHSEEADTARSAALWFTNRDSAGSAHRCVDDSEHYMSLPDNFIPWAAPGANTIGLHIEQAGFAAWPRFRWIKRLKSLHKTANIMARWSLKYGIPLKRLRGTEVRTGSGFCGHVDCTRAFGGTHTDPGEGYPYGRVGRMARRRRAVIKAARKLRRRS